LEYSQTVHQLFIDFKKAYDSVRREVLYNILLGFRVPMKLVRLIKMCLNETYMCCSIGHNPLITVVKMLRLIVYTGAAEITPTFRKITVGSPKQVVGCGPFR
jgi:hypothetical protein